MRKEGSHTKNNPSKRQKVDTVNRNDLNKPAIQGKHLLTQNGLFKDKKLDTSKSCLVKSKKASSEKKVQWENKSEVKNEKEFFDSIVVRIYNHVSGRENASPPNIQDIKTFLNELGLKDEETVNRFYDSEAGYYGILDQALTFDRSSYLLEFIQGCIHIYPSLQQTIKKKLSDGVLLLDFIEIENARDARFFRNYETKQNFRETKIKILFEIDPQGTQRFFRQNQENMSGQLINEVGQVSLQNKCSIKL